MTQVRRIQFEGDDTAYIQFLEARVLELERIVRHSSQPETYNETIYSLRNRPGSNGVSSQHEFFELANRNQGQIHGVSENRSRGRNMQHASGNREQRRRDPDRTHGDCATLKIIEYSPKHNIKHAGLDPGGTDKCVLSQSKEQQLKVLSKFSTFLDDLPQSQVWKDWVSALHGSQRRKFLQALVQDCVSGASSFVSLDPPSSKSTEISILLEYGNSMMANGMINRQLACFRELIFISLCAVALRVTENKDSVYEIMRKVLGSNAYSRQFEKLVRGAKWANSIISLLSQTKWEYSCWDAICVAEHPVSFYARFAEFSIEPEQVLKGMRNNNVFNDSLLGQPKNTPVPLAIPLIIERVFRDSASLREICHCLNYDLSIVESYRLLFNTALDNKKRSMASMRSEPSKIPCRDHISCSPPDDEVARTNSARGSPLMEDITSQTPPADAFRPFSNLPNFSDTPSQLLAADPFPASDFPHSLFDNLAGLSESTPSQPLAADPFPASDFPHDLFDNLAGLSEGTPNHPLTVDPFSASDFPHGIFDDLPGLLRHTPGLPSAPDLYRGHHSEVPGDFSATPVAHVNSPTGSRCDPAGRSIHPLTMAEPLLDDSPARDSFAGVLRAQEDIQREIHNVTSPRSYERPGKFNDAGAAQAVC